MRLSSVFSYLRRLLIPVSLSVVRMGGCAPTTHFTHNTITTQSCTANAQSVRFTLTYSDLSIGTPSFEAGTLNLVGVPAIVDLGGAFQVTAGLNHAGLGELVHMVFKATTLGLFSAVAVSDVEFFTVPPEQIANPGCKEGVSPAFALINHALYGAALQASDPLTQPLALSTLQLVESPAVLDAAALDWTNPTFNALPWQNAIDGTTILDPGGPPLIIDLPEQLSPGTRAVLCRFVSFDQGREFRGIVEADLVNVPIATRPTTWGAVKALYRQE